MIELRSPYDSLAALQEKLLEYLENGARLEWLIDPEPKQVHVYRPNRDVERLDEAVELPGEPELPPGEPELPGLVVDLRAIWSPGF